MTKREYILLGLCAVVLLAWLRSCTFDTFDERADEYRRGLERENAYDMGLQSGYAKKDSDLVAALAERETKITIIEKKLQTPEPPRFTASSADSAFLYFIQFAEENK